MRALASGAAGERLRTERRPVPEPGEGEVLVRVVACGVCRTDLHVVDGELPSARAGVAIGIALALLSVWITLRLSVPIARVLPDSIIHLLTRIMGLLLSGIAVQMIFTGTRDWIHIFG